MSGGVDDAAGQDADEAESQVQADQMDVDDVPPPPIPHPIPRGPSERRARVEVPPPVPDEGPTYYRLGVDHIFSAEDPMIHIQCGRIKKLENLEVVGANLKNLTLIANLIEKIEGLTTNVNLEHLELYQNLLKRIENISHLSGLTNLDLSFNKIRSSAPLADCHFQDLRRLYLSSNKITDIEGVFHLTNIEMLEFGSNRVRAIPPQLSQLTNLKELWLGKNKIVSMALPPLPNLRHLSLQSNRLEIWDESLFHNAPGLQYLYFGHNNLPDLPEEFAILTDLKELDLAGNVITKIKPVPQLKNLVDLWMNDNKIDDLAEIANLAAFPALKTIYLERNPMQGLGIETSMAAYKEAIMQAVPELLQLDAVRIGSKVTVVTDGTENDVIGIRKR